MSENTSILIGMAIVLLGFLGMLRGCQDYDLNARCIEATGALCVEVTKDL